MVKYKYTEDVLRAAVAACVTMADVLRHLGIAQNGGAHAHLRRRIDALGIDTSHFLGRAHNRGRCSRHRLSSSDVLVLRDRHRRRAHPEVLRRALAEHGLPTQCVECGIGPFWQGKSLTLHVDHLNGEFWDCRLDNLRLLCPNCHSQTPTYAGRNRRIFGVVTTRAADALQVAPGDRRQVAQDELLGLIARVDRRELTATEAARLAGCHRNHFYRLRRRLAETGSVAPRPGGRRWRANSLRETVIAYALDHPDLGSKRIACELANAGYRISHGTISTILREAGLNTAAARHSRLGTPAGVAERQTRQV